MSNCSVVRSEVLVPGVPFGTFRYLASERGQFSLRSVWFAKDPNSNAETFARFCASTVLRNKMLLV